MKAIKPYLFWIICGVILLIQIAVMFLIAPGVESNPGMTPSESKSELTNKWNTLQKLVGRATTTIEDDGPTQRFRPADAQARDNLIKKYIINASEWEQPLKDIVAEYQSMLTAVTNELATRSEGLDEGVSDATDRAVWYDNGYRVETVKLLRLLIDSGLVVHPSGKGVSDEALATDRGLRTRLNLYTKGEQYPTIPQHRELSRNFRLVQRIGLALRPVKVDSVTNPVVGPREGEASGVVLEKITINPGSGPHAAHVITLDLAGTPNALHAAMKVLDGINQPIVTRLGSNWTRRSNFGSGELSGADAPMSLTTTLVVMDFSG